MRIVSVSGCAAGPFGDSGGPLELAFPRVSARFRLSSRFRAFPRVSA